MLEALHDAKSEQIMAVFCAASWFPQNKKFFLDTNVLYWYTYPRFAENLTRQARPYYDFVDALVSSGNPLYTSVYNLTELLNVVEKNEYEIFKNADDKRKYFTHKDYRRVAEERDKLMQIMKVTLSNAKSTCNIINFPFEISSIEKFTNNLVNHRCDVFDYLILENSIVYNKITITRYGGRLIYFHSVRIVGIRRIMNFWIDTDHCRKENKGLGWYS